MGKFLKRLFIPHRHNDHQPHILRPKLAAVVTIGIVVCEALFLGFTFFILPGSSFLAAVLSSVLVEETNHNRVVQNLGALEVNPRLIAAAEAKAKDMATRGYFAHDTPEGLKPWYWLQESGYVYQAAGENLAVNFVDSKDVVDAWMKSPLHRANILGSQFTEIGIATAEGVFEGKKAIFIVQFFGTPRSSFTPIAEASSEPSPISSAIGTEPQELQVRGAAESSNDDKIEEPPQVLDKPPLGVISTPPVVTGIPSTAPVGFFEKMAVQPRTVITYVLGFLLIFFFGALMLKIFVNLQIQYPVLIANGVFLVGVLAFLIVANDYLSLSKALIF